MKDSTMEILEKTIERHKALEAQRSNILNAFKLLLCGVKEGGKILLCGNGGSAADCEHIAGELLKRFKKHRPIDEKVKANLLEMGEDGKFLADNLEGAISAISLTSHLSFSTAFAHDKNPHLVYAQQLYALGKAGDVLISLSTSGNSKNCVYAIIAAKAKGIKTISFTGKRESQMSRLSDVAIQVPEEETFLVQELHLPIYHCLCAMLEEEMF